MLRPRIGHLRRHSGPPVLRPDGPVGAVLVSHAHFDHLDLPSLRRFGRDVPVFAPSGVARRLRRKGFRRVVAMRAGESARIDGRVTLQAVAADHDGRRFPWDPDGETIGFVIIGSRRIYFAGDTGPITGAERAARSPDLALLPIWGWGHRLGPGHMDPRDAARTAALLRPGLTVPIHWGTYFPFGMKSFRGALLEKPPAAFREQMKTLAPDLDLRVLRPGGSVGIPAART